MMILFITLTALDSLAPAGLDRAVPTPLDFRPGTGQDPAFLSAIHQIECDGQRLYFRSGREPYILITDLEGTIVGSLGGKGGHPSEFGERGVLAMAVDGDTVSGIDLDLRFIRFYRNGAYHSHLRLQSYNARAAHATSNLYAFSQDHVVVPALAPGHLAVAYHRHNKSERPIGEILAIGKEEEQQALNATLWRYHDGFWYAAHIFFPMVSVFDGRFELVRQFQIRHELTDRYITYLSDFQADENFTRVGNLVSDFKIFRGHLFLMMQGNLFQVEADTGAVESVTHFYGKGADFGVADGHKITLPLFAFAEDGRLFAAHPALLWNHDFWQARLPTLKEAALRAELP